MLFCVLTWTKFLTHFVYSTFLWHFKCKILYIRKLFVCSCFIIEVFVTYEKYCFKIITLELFSSDSCLFIIINLIFHHNSEFAELCNLWKWKLWLCIMDCNKIISSYIIFQASEIFPVRGPTKLFQICMISGFCHSVNETLALLGLYTA